MTEAEEATEADHRAEWQRRCESASDTTLQYYYELHTRWSVAAPSDRLAMIRAQAALVEGARRNLRLLFRHR